LEAADSSRAGQKSWTDEQPPRGACPDGGWGAAASEVFLDWNWMDFFCKVRQTSLFSQPPRWVSAICSLFLSTRLVFAFASENSPQGQASAVPLSSSSPPGQLPLVFVLLPKQGRDTAAPTSHTATIRPCHQRPVPELTGARVVVVDGLLYTLSPCLFEDLRL